jgi:tetratricopeptide (TPR) repeat protein
VVGKVFWRGALLAIEDGSRGADLEDALDLLETRDFVRRESSSQIQGDREYTFKHMLIREVAYSTLPRAARRERHAAVARFIQDSAGERIGEAAAVLAHHWREAGDTQRALDNLLLAAEQASRGWAKGEAVTLYGQALELIPEDRHDLRRRVALLQAETMVDLGNLTGGIPLLDDLLPQLEGRDLLSAMLTRSRAAFWTMDAPTTTRLAQEAVALAEQLDDKEFLGPATALQSNATSMEGRLEEAFELNERAFDLWQPGKRQTEFAVAMDQRALDHYWAGQYEEGERWARQGLALAEEIKSTESILRIGAIYGVLLTGLGRHEEALPIFEDTIARGKDVELEPRWTARVMNMSSTLYRDVFDTQESRRRNAEAAELGARAGFLIAEVQAGIDLIFADLMEGEPGRAERRWPELWERAQASKGWHQWLMVGRLLEARAEIALATGDVEAAARHADEAVAQSVSVWRLKYETSGRLVLGSALARMGQVEEGVRELRTATDGADRLRHPPAIWQAWSELGRALAASGDDEGAGSAFAKADETIRSFAAALAPERSERLLSAEPIKEILAAR